jgi:predicted acyltransferase
MVDNENKRSENTSKKADLIIPGTIAARTKTLIVLPGVFSSAVSEKISLLLPRIIMSGRLKLEKRSLVGIFHGSRSLGNKTRLLSLDSFRGLTIACMILVNSPGSYGAVYSQLKHAEWNGWTFADTIFPSFLLIVGVSLVFSISGRKENGVTSPRLEAQIVRRTIILFGLGLFVNSFPIFHLSTIRIPGVLQRIALCYFFASLIIMRCGLRGRVLWLVALLSSYWLMMRFIPVPEIGTGVIEPGRNFAAYVDSLFLSGHMWSYYETWDPEGLISTLPAIGTTLFGVLAGDLLKSSLSVREKALSMILAGVFLILAGTMLDPWLPINKSIWTSTFAIFMAGLALIIFALFYWIIDIKDFSLWARPLIIFGVNPITIYVLSEVLDTALRFMNLSIPNGYAVSCRSYLFRNYCVPIALPETASFLYALGYLLSMFLIAWAMWKRRFIIRV